MAIRRTGNRTVFWDGTSAFNQSTNPRGGVGVLANSTSNITRVPFEIDQIMIVVFTPNAASSPVVSVECPHFGGLTSEGLEPDASNPPAGSLFYPLFYSQGTPTAISLSLPAVTGGWGASIMIPDWVGSWVRLRTTIAGTYTAGWEGVSQ